jgi:hypothetical protein
MNLRKTLLSAAATVATAIALPSAAGFSITLRTV